MDAPLFLGYLFLRVDVEGQDRPLIERLPGVLSWVRFGAVVPVVPDHREADPTRGSDKQRERAVEQVQSL
jgi:transcription antitermination factor NusG